MAKCKKCKGTGEWERMDKNLVCPDCSGKGVVASEPLDPKEQARIEKEAEKYVRNFVHPHSAIDDYIAGAKAEHQKFQIAIDALEQIAHPIKHLQDMAEKTGEQLNGMMAIMITNDPNYSRSIAEVALKKLIDSQTE